MGPISIADIKEFGWKVCMLCAMLKLLPLKINQQMDGWMNMTDYVDPYITYTNQNPA